MADKRDYIAKLTEILDQFWDKGGTLDRVLAI